MAQDDPLQSESTEPQKKRSHWIPPLPPATPPASYSNYWPLAFPGVLLAVLYLVLTLAAIPSHAAGGSDELATIGIFLTCLVGIIAVVGLLAVASQVASPMALLCALLVSLPFSLGAIGWLLSILADESQQQMEHSSPGGPSAGPVVFAMLAIASSVGLAIGLLVALRRDA